MTSTLRIGKDSKSGTVSFIEEIRNKYYKIE